MIHSSELMNSVALLVGKAGTARNGTLLGPHSTGSASIRLNQKMWNCQRMFWCFVSLWVDWRQLTEIKPRSKLLSLFIFDIYSCWLSHMTLAASAPHWVIFQKSREICFVPSPWFSFELATGSVNWFKLLNYSLRQQARPTGIIASVCPKTSFKKIKSTGLSKF